MVYYPHPIIFFMSAESNTSFRDDKVIRFIDRDGVEQSGTLSQILSDPKKGIRDTRDVLAIALYALYYQEPENK